MSGGAPRRVSLFVTCLVDQLFPEVGESAVLLLRDLGVDVDFPRAQTCCGQPAYNSGFDIDARRMARTLLDAFEDAETVVTPSGSCAAMVRVTFPSLFGGTADEERARSLAARTVELTELLVDVVGTRRVAGSFPARGVYHDSCHGLRELHLGGQGRWLLEGIDGLELMEMARPDTCCGFGGTFSVRMPSVSTAMADDEISRASAAGADVVIGGDIGCLMHLGGRASRTGIRLRTMHVAEVLARARGLLPGGPPW